MDNPYASPTSDDDSTDRVDRKRDGGRARCFVRCVIYSHVLGIVICGLFSYWDRYGDSRAIPDVVAGLLLFPSLLTLFVCPLLVAGAVISGALRGRDRVLACVVEGGLVGSQLFALLPAVS